jgi:hypothetical protein
MDAHAEELYYRTQVRLPRPSLRPLISVAAAVGLILLLIEAAQA